MLIRVGSRGSRLALTQAELASARLRAPGIEIALVPITTAGDQDRTKPFGEIGSRGVFVKELEEALLERRIDVAVHSAKDMTTVRSRGSRRRRVPRARRSARRAVRRDGDPRRGCGSAPRPPGGSAQLLALEPTLSIEPLRGNIDTRLRKRGERGLDAVVLAACGLDRLGLARRDRPPLRPGRAAARGGAGRARAAGARRRGGARRRAPITRRRAAASRPSAPRSQPSAAAASRPSRRTTTARRSLRSSPPRTARGSSGAAATTRWRSASSSCGSRSGEDRRHPRRRAGGAARRAARGARPRGRPLSPDPHRAARRRPDRPDALRLGRRDEPERRGRARAPARRLRRRTSRRSARRPPTRCARSASGSISSRRSRRRRGCSRSFRRAGCSSPPRRARGACSSTSATPIFVALYRTVELRPETPPDGDLVLLASGSAARAFAATEARIPVVAIGPQTAAVALGLGLDVVGVAESHDVEGLLDVVRSLP